MNDSNQRDAVTGGGNVPAVSVIMATYHSDNTDFLREAVESVLAQTWRDFEFLIVMDGPIPESARGYLENTAANDQRVSLIRLDGNHGQAHARNVAIQRAQGEFIAVTDSDDVNLPDRLDKQVAFIKETGADLVGGAYYTIDEYGAITGIRYEPRNHRQIARALCFLNPIANPTVLARRDVLKNNPYPDNRRRDGYVFGEDYALWVTLARKGEVLRNLPEPVAKLRMDRNYVSRRRGFNRFYTDLCTKLRAVSIHPWYRRPFGLVAGMAIASLRLLPAPCLKPAYRLRDRIRFGRMER